MLYHPDKLRFIGDPKKSRRIQNKPNATRLFYRHSTFSLFHHFLSAHRHKQEED